MDQVSSQRMACPGKAQKTQLRSATAIHGNPAPLASLLVVARSMRDSLLSLPCPHAVGSLMLFNSNLVPYHKYNAGVDNLLQGDAKEQEQAEVERSLCHSSSVKIRAPKAHLPVKSARFSPSHCGGPNTFP